ncbi:MAG: alcohol dehydrogenase catalytic domain-containing protein, partial [Gemmatimonas sp.]
MLAHGRQRRPARVPARRLRGRFWHDTPPVAPPNFRPVTTMRCVVVREHGGIDKLQLTERPIPSPGPGEVRVRVRAIGLNHLDTWVRRGVPGHTFPLPLVPSSDAAGVIDALGPGASGHKEGDAVVVLPGVSCGA